ncbi:MAG: GFA family protein [Sandaracinaceae bacterium]|nr:GFA family protein [Sandaracinaceae bacterium]
MANPVEGGCACEAVRYRLVERPLFVHCCHCTWCRRESGSAFAINALIETSFVELLEGRPKRVPLTSASGKGQDVMRCEVCGTAVWSHYAGKRDALAFIRVGTLDDPSVAPPDIHIFTSSKLPWVVLPEGVTAVEEYYRRSEHWPAESYARYQALA